jgi:hypothetical protein
MIGCNAIFVLDNLLLYVLSGSITPEEVGRTPFLGPGYLRVFEL